MELKCICPVCGKVAGVESRDCIVAQHRPRAKDAEKITAALTAWHVAGDALDTALGALVADATAPAATTGGA